MPASLLLLTRARVGVYVFVCGHGLAHGRTRGGEFSFVVFIFFPPSLVLVTLQKRPAGPDVVWNGGV